MAKDVVSTAVTGCTFGSMPSVLVIGDDHGDVLEGNNSANVSDHVPFKNILPFGMCCSPLNPGVINGIPTPCIPLTPLPWTPGNDTLYLDNEKILDDLSVCPCIWSGIIGILDAGQDSWFNGETVPEGRKKEIEKEALAKIEELKKTEHGKAVIQQIKDYADHASKLISSTPRTPLMQEVSDPSGGKTAAEYAEDKWMYWNITTVEVFPKWRKTALGKDTGDISSLIRMPGKTSEKIISSITDKYRPESSYDTVTVPENFSRWDMEISDPELLQEATESLSIDNAAELNDGWIYVFAKCGGGTINSDFNRVRLFKEYKIISAPGRNYYSEIDLSYYSGSSLRVPGGCRYDIEVPYKFERYTERKGTETQLFDEVYVTYSPTQLSWDRINRYGGISPDDSRLVKLPGNNRKTLVLMECRDRIDAEIQERFGKALPAKELTDIYNVQYEGKNPVPKDCTGTDAVGAWESTSLFYDSRLLPVLLLSDPAGEVLEGNTLLLNLTARLRDVMDNMTFTDYEKKFKNDTINTLCDISEFSRTTEYSIPRTYRDKETGEKKQTEDKVKAGLKEMIGRISEIAKQVPCLSKKENRKLLDRFKTLLGGIEIYGFPEDVKEYKEGVIEEFKNIIGGIPREKAGDESKDISYEYLSALTAFQTFIKKDYPDLILDDYNKLYLLGDDGITPDENALISWNDAEKSIDMRKIDYYLRKAERECLHRLIAAIQRTNTDIMLSRTAPGGGWLIDINNEIKDFFAVSNETFGQGYRTIDSLIAPSCISSRNIDFGLRANTEYQNTYSEIDGRRGPADRPHTIGTSVLHTRVNSFTVNQRRIIKNNGNGGTSTTVKKIVEESPAGFEYLLALQDTSFPLHCSIFHAKKYNPEVDSGKGIFNPLAFKLACRPESSFGTVNNMAKVVTGVLQHWTAKTHDAYYCKLDSEFDKLGKTGRVGQFMRRISELIKLGFNEKDILSSAGKLNIEFYKKYDRKMERLKKKNKTPYKKKEKYARNKNKIQYEEELRENYRNYETFKSVTAPLHGLLMVFALCEITKQIDELCETPERIQESNPYKARVMAGKALLEMGISLRTIRDSARALRDYTRTGKAVDSYLIKTLSGKPRNALGIASDVISRWGLIADVILAADDILSLVNTLSSQGRIDHIDLASSVFKTAGDSLLAAAAVNDTMAEDGMNTIRAGEQAFSNAAKIGRYASLDFLGETEIGFQIFEFLTAPEGWLVIATTFLIISAVIEKYKHSRYRKWVDFSTLGKDNKPYEPWKDDPHKQYAALVSMLTQPQFTVELHDEWNDECAVSVKADVGAIAKFIDLEDAEFVFQNIWIYEDKTLAGMQYVDPKGMTDKKFENYTAKFTESKRDPENNTVYYSYDDISEDYKSLVEMVKKESAIVTATYIIPAGHLKFDGYSLPLKADFIEDEGELDEMFGHPLIYDEKLKSIVENNWVDAQKNLIRRYKS